MFLSGEIVPYRKLKTEKLEKQEKLVGREIEKFIFSHFLKTHLYPS